MNRYDKLLTTLYVITLLAALAVYVFFEFVHPQAGASVVSEPSLGNVQFAAETATCLLTIALVYLAARLLTFTAVKKRVATDERIYFRWALLRWAMLALVIFLGEGVHYFYQSPSTVGCPIIGVLVFFFVWPTKGRREQEMMLETLENETVTK